MNYETENFFDKEVTFTYEGMDYLWIGDYSIESYDGGYSEFAPAYAEIEIKVDHTSSLASCEDGQEISPTFSMIQAIAEEILNNL